MRGRTRLLASGGLVGLAYLALLLAATTGHPAPAAGALVALVLLDPLIAAATKDDDPRTERVLHLGGLDTAWRVVVRDVLAVVALLTGRELSTAAAVAVVAAVLAHHLVAGAHGVTLNSALGRRSRRVETRNLDVPGQDLPAPLPAPWVRWAPDVVRWADVLLVLGLVLTVATDADGWAVAGAVATAVAAVGLALPAVAQLRALLRLPGDEKRYRAAQRAVLDLEPLVVLYFTGDDDAAYQVNMWFETMERLDRRVLVLVRERRYWDDLQPTTLPVLCLPASVDVMNLHMPSARVGLFVANAGRNIHLLREPGIKSAFIGHGDSDKVASFNPFTKVYDEVWVAGEAGRDRYRRADVGVRDDAVRLVGRPQLDVIEPARPRPDGAPFTVLYAPTWEGWTEDLAQSSVRPMGEAVVRTLLAAPGVRVVYKPHPLTGKVDPAAGRANERVLGLVRAAGAPHLAVVDGARPLYDWFNEADALVSDISSVVSDFLRSGKPYFVTNNAGLPDEEFRTEYPSAAAAYLLGPGAAGLAEGLAAARGDDPLCERRVETRRYLIGDPDVDALTLFRDAVDALAARARGQDGTPTPATDAPAMDAAGDEVAAEDPAPRP